MAKKRYWFKAKKYGWGWYPASWEGFLVIGIYLFYVVWRTHIMGTLFDTMTSIVFRLFFETILPTALLIAVCYLKGEKPRWRWGND